MSTVVDLKTKEEKDAELDRRIEALRKKNEALVRRYQEIEEDKKKAEQEGIAVKTHPPRKGRPQDGRPQDGRPHDGRPHDGRPHDGPPEGDRRRTEKENFTVTIDLSKPAGEKRVKNEWKKGPPRGRRDSEEGDVPRQLDDSPPRRPGSGRLSRGGQRGGGQRPDRREQRPDRPLADPRQAHDRPPREDRGPGMEGPGEVPGRGAPRGGRRARGGRGRDDGGPQGGDRMSKEWEEKRRQNIEKMNEEMEMIAEYERGQRPTEGDKPIRNFLDDPRRSGPVPDMDRKEGSRRHVRNWGGLDFDNVKTGSEQEKEWTSRRSGGGPWSGRGSTDMTMSMTGRERAEYLRWKKEREEIDEERLARHRNATGQWKREWDAQKTDTMFKEDPAVATEDMLPDKAGSRRDDVKRPPQAPTFGDFLGQGRGPREGERGERGRGRERGQRQSYSMHDNRWEGEKEDQNEEKQDLPKRERTQKKEERKPKVSSPQKIEKRSDAEEDDDEWSDVEVGDEEEGEEEEGEEEEQEQEGENRQSPTKSPGSEMAAGKSVPTSPFPSPQQSDATPKEKRKLRPKINITSAQETRGSSECTKPLSPFSLLDGHQPVTDWGEEMEMQSPRSSIGESPLKPPGTEGSPAQVRVQKDGLDSSPGTAEPELEKVLQSVVVTAAALSAEPLIQVKTAPSLSSEPVYATTTPPENEETVTPSAQETSAASNQEEETVTPSAQETSAASNQEEETVTPSAQETSAASNQEEETVTPSAQETSAASNQEEETVTPSAQETSAASNQEEETITPSAQKTPAAPPENEETVTPSAQETSAASNQEEETITPSAQETSAAPSENEETVTPSAQETSAAPTQEEETVTPLAQETSAAPTQEEETVTLPAQETSAAIPENEEIVTPSAQETLAASTQKEETVTPSSQETPASLTYGNNPAPVETADAAVADAAVAEADQSPSEPAHLIETIPVTSAQTSSG
ncbi:hypothetical protein DPEC_G00242200 [Dallia pectoralis]|uniref:Uncharacterized protein n=1 Tax=Dallia pectoralis TaxID=75939 RepID=A0ACC2FV29_DALPE|nr:hypothetical protein DPEC_G00242200 [Dallia pectoralis]